MSGIFLGFFIIITVSGFVYFVPPREIFVGRVESGFSLIWRASKFKNLYSEEYEKILEIFGKQTPA